MSCTWSFRPNHSPFCEFCSGEGHSLFGFVSFGAFFSRRTFLLWPLGFFLRAPCYSRVLVFLHGDPVSLDLKLPAPARKFDLGAAISRINRIAESDRLAVAHAHAEIAKVTAHKFQHRVGFLSHGETRI